MQTLMHEQVENCMPFDIVWLLYKFILYSSSIILKLKQNKIFYTFAQ